MAGGWGLEAVHSWDGGAAVLNDVSAFPHVKLDSISGLRSLGDLEASADAAVNRRGEIPRASSRSGKTVAYNGRIRAQTLDAMRTLEESLLAAFESTVEKEMLITPNATYAPGATPRRFLARAVDCDIVDEQKYSFNRVTRGFERDFYLSLRLSDPRLYEAAGAPAGGAAGANAATNLVTNPRAGAGATTGWTNTGLPSFVPIPDLPAVDGLPSGAGSTGFLFVGDGNDDRATALVAVVNGTQYTFSVYLLALSLTGGGTVRLQARRADGTTVIASSAAVNTVGPFVRLSVTFNAPATENAMICLQQASAGAISGYVSAFQAEAAAAASDYFDGDMPNASWSGNSHASTSTRRQRRDASPNVGGKIDTEPTITITGDGTALALRHRGLDRWLSFEGQTLNAGQTLVIDFAKRTMLINGVIDASNWLDRAASDWWDEGVPGLLPGANVVELYRTGAGDLSVAWRNAYPA